MKTNVQITEHFTLGELWSPDTCEIYCDELFWKHMDMLEEARCQFGGRLKVNSGHRSAEHNKKVGGAERSMHLRFATDLHPLGRAGDLLVALSELYFVCKSLGFSGIGRYNSFLHVDHREFIDRPGAEWDYRS